MRRISLCVALVALAACAKTETKTDTTSAMSATPMAPAPINLADLAGTWTGSVMPMDKDTTLATVETVATATKEGWTMKLSNGATAPLTIVAVDGDSIVATAANFKSAVKKGRTVKTLQSIYHAHDGMLMGVVHATYDNGDTASFRTNSTKKAP